MYPSPIHEEHHGRSWGPLERGPTEQQRGRTLSPALERAFTQPSLHGSLERGSQASNGQNLSLERGYNQSSGLERGSHSNSSSLERGPYSSTSLERGPYHSTSLERGQTHLERGPYPASSLERGSKMSNSLERGPKNNSSSLERGTRSTNTSERDDTTKHSLGSKNSLERSANHITEGESNHSKEKGRTQSPPPEGVSPAPSGGKIGDDTQSILSLTLR